MRDRLLKKIAAYAAEKPWHVLLVTIVVTLVTGGLAGNLQMKMEWSDMMPSNHPMTLEFTKIIEQFSSATNIVIVAEGNEEDLKVFADEIAPKVEALTKYVRRVDYKTDVDFFKEHALMLMKEKDIKNAGDLLSDANLIPMLTHLNDNFEKEYIQAEDPLTDREEEDKAVIFLDGIEYWIETMRAFISGGGDESMAETAVDRLLLGEEYMVSYDKKMLILIVQPTFSMMDMDKSIAAVNMVEEIVKTTAQGYPGIAVGLTGSITLQRDEMVALTSDMMFTSWISLTAIVLLFIIAFRMLTAPLLAVAVLILGVTWTAGLSYLIIGNLNIMTSMFSVILIGLGIDFSIHIISGFSELRSQGVPPDEAIEKTLLKVGRGVITGGLTSAAAFMTLLIGDTRGMSEMGLVIGIGVISCVIAAIVSLPALLILRERYRSWRGKSELAQRDISYRMMGRASTLLARKWVFTLPAVFLLILIFGGKISDIGFDSNYLNMEPEGLESVDYQYKMLDKLDLSTDFGMVTTNDLERAREIAKKARKLKIVALVTSISDYVPSPEEAERRRPLIEEIRRRMEAGNTDDSITHRDIPELVKQLERLEDNIIELSDMAYLGGQDKVDMKAKGMVGDPEAPESGSRVSDLISLLMEDNAATVTGLNGFQQVYRRMFRSMAFGMTNTEEITVESLPENIRSRFLSKEDGMFLVTMYPSEQVWDLEFMERFSRQLWEIDPRTTGTPPTMLAMMEIVKQDGKRAAGLALIIIFILLMLDFRKISHTIFAMIPLLVGVVFMLGIMSFSGIQLTVVNVMGLPMILGIGIDDGVHILHRYRREGAGSIGIVFSSTGKAVLLTSITTMLAFGSLLFATYRGFGSLGSALFIGVGSCFIATVLILPALFGFLERRG